MTIAVITGSSGLVGSESAYFFAKKGLNVIGIDNDMRSYFFGKEASTIWNRKRLKHRVPNYVHVDVDIRDQQTIKNIFSKYNKDIAIVIHAAAQPSHDWAAREPITDFTVNANGTLELLEMTRKYAGEAVFIYVSTNKVYGNTPNRLPLIELETRWEIKNEHPYFERGIDESMSIDQTTHSLFGVSKTAGDLLVQEYGRYFDMKTACFRCGCLTGSDHSGAQLHGFLAYLMKCLITVTPYTVFGYKGKQVRDNIHSSDLVKCFWQFFQNPHCGEVYNIGGGRFSNCSVSEAIGICEKVADKTLNWSYCETNRIGDHIWWISDCGKFQSHYPEWQPAYSIEQIIKEIYDGMFERLKGH